MCSHTNSPSSSKMMYYSVFVGQLPRNATKEELCELFEACGKIDDIYISHSLSHMVFSFGFIRFIESTSVVKAVQHLGPWTLHGQALKVELSYATKEYLKQTTGPRFPSSRTVTRDQDDRSRLKEACFILNKELDLVHNDEPVDSVWLLTRLELKPVNFAPRLKGTVGPETRTTKQSLYDNIGAICTEKPSAIAKRKLMRSMDRLQADLQNHLLKHASLATAQRKGACNLEKASHLSDPEDDRSETAPTADQRNKQGARSKVGVQRSDLQNQRCSESVAGKKEVPRNAVPKRESPKELREMRPSQGGFTSTEMNTRRAVLAADGRRMVSDLDNSDSDHPAATPGSGTHTGQPQLLNGAPQYLNTEGVLSILPPAAQFCNQLGMPSRLLQQFITSTSDSLNTSNAEAHNAVMTKALCLGLGVLVELGSNALQGFLQVNTAHSLPKQLTDHTATAPGATQAACPCHTPPPDQQRDSPQSDGNTPPQSQGQPSRPTPGGRSLPQNKPGPLSKSAGWQRLRDRGSSQGGTTVPPKPPLARNGLVDVARSAHRHSPPQNHGSASGNRQTNSTTSDPFLTKKKGAANSSRRSCTLSSTEIIAQTSQGRYSSAWDQDEGPDLLAGKDKRSKERINPQTSPGHYSSTSDQGHDPVTGKDKHSRKKINPRSSTPNSSSPSEQGECPSFERDELLVSGQSSVDDDEEGGQRSGRKAAPRQDALKGIHAEFGDEMDRCLAVDDTSWFQCGVTYSRMQVGSQSDSGISLTEVSQDAESQNGSLDTAAHSARCPDQAVWAVAVSKEKPTMSSEKVQCCEEAGSGSSRPVSAMAKEEVWAKSLKVREKPPSGTTLQNGSASKAKGVVTASGFQGKMVQGGRGHGGMTAPDVQGKSKLQGGRGRGSVSLLKQVKQQLLTGCSSTALVLARGRGQSAVL